MVAAIGSWLALACGCVAETTPNELVQQLGDPSYRVREAATRALIELGATSKSALKNGLADPDPEIRTRCEWLLPRVNSIDLALRLEKFLADPDDPANHDLPGLARYTQIVGTSEAARQLYIETIQRHGELIERIENDRRQAAQHFRVFAMDFLARRRIANAVPAPMIGERADLIAFFLLGSDPATRSADIPYLQISQMLRMPTFTQLSNARDEEGDAVRRLFLAWGELQTNSSVLLRVFSVAGTTEMREILPFALRHLQDRQALVRTKACAALVIGKLGTKEHLPHLEALLDNEIVVITNNLGGQISTVQLRDVALAMCVQITGEKFEDYGFTPRNNFPISVTSYYQFGFTDDEKREAAHKKWRDR